MRLGRMQLQIMQALWERGHATAREITDAISQHRPVAHSTVQTLLRKMEAKRLVRHRSEDRTFIFSPMVSQAEVMRSATSDLIMRMFEGSPSGLVAYLVKNEKLSNKELAEIRQVIEEARS